jgi:hypothetical protein
MHHHNMPIYNVFLIYRTECNIFNAIGDDSSGLAIAFRHARGTALIHNQI